MLTHALASAQAFLVCAVFIVAGSSKLLPGSIGLADVQTPLTRSLPASLVPAAWGALGVLELALALTGLVPISSQISLAASASLLTLFTSYQIWIARVGPGAPCGCFGAHLRETASAWTILRTGLLAVAAAGGAVLGGTSGTDRSALFLAGALAIAEGLLLASLSVSVRGRALALIRGSGQDCATVRVPLEVTLAALRRSEAWHRCLPNLANAEEVRDQWRAGCWRFISFNADFQGRAAIAVFAARVGDNRPEIRVAFVDQDSDVILASEESAGLVGATVPAT